MATALILSGGTGTRMGANIPKQYISVKDKPIIGYCLDTFQEIDEITRIVIVADVSWQAALSEYIEGNHISKFAGYADAGVSRQHSILNGLRRVRACGALGGELVIIHDAARPCVSEALVCRCLELLAEYDCTMPVIPVKDTVYLSDNCREISKLLNRDKLFAGQAPEGCHLGSYLAINEALSDDELKAVRGTSAIAFEKGLTVGLFPGSEGNYKITTREDLEKFELEMEHNQ